MGPRIPQLFLTGPERATRARSAPASRAAAVVSACELEGLTAADPEGTVTMIAMLTNGDGQAVIRSERGIDGVLGSPS